jgi:thiosulfate/3-mercaptopyruvate sulfurtransferase
MVEYAHPETLVDTAWVAKHRNDAGVRIVEVDVDTAAYETGHIPGAIAWNWTTQLCDTVQRDIIPRAAFEKLMADSGIANDTTVVLYGDNNDWFAAWALWQMKIYGHEDVRLMNGGRRKWIEEGGELTKEVPSPAKASYVAKDPDFSIRAFLPEVLEALKWGSTGLVDVRSPDEYTGKILAPPGLPETCQRGGHIPGAKSIPWGQACREDGTFKSADELKALYEGMGITPDKPAIAYCRIGERSSHTWYVLKYLLGYGGVKNYDGSWTEWGNLVGAPVERAAGKSAGATTTATAVQATLKPEEYRRRKDEYEGWPIHVVSYKLGNEYVCEVDNVSPGARLARVQAATRDDAERRALEKVHKKLRETRTFGPD